MVLLKTMEKKKSNSWAQYEKIMATLLTNVNR